MLPNFFPLSLFPGCEEEANLDAVEGTAASSRTPRAARVTRLLFAIGPHIETPVNGATAVTYRQPQLSFFVIVSLLLLVHYTLSDLRFARPPF